MTREEFIDKYVHPWARQDYCDQFAADLEKVVAVEEAKLFLWARNAAKELQKAATRMRLAAGVIQLDKSRDDAHAWADELDEDVKGAREFGLLEEGR